MILVSITMTTNSSLPHHNVPSKEPTLAPMPPMPPPSNLRSGYNPSTSSSPIPSPQGSRSSSPQRSSRFDTLAPPTGDRIRLSRSASPLANHREPLLPDLDKINKAQDDSVQPNSRGLPGPASANQITKLGDDSKIGAMLNDIVPSFHPTKSLGANNNFSRPLSNTSMTSARLDTKGVLPIKSSHTARQGTGRGLKGPPPSINLPMPPVPQVPVQFRTSIASTNTEPSSSAASSLETSFSDRHGKHTSQLSNKSQSSITSPSSLTSNASSCRSSTVNETAALNRTLSATKSIKSDRSGRDQKGKRSKFLKRKTTPEPISKPLISPPTMIHSETTSPLPQLRNRSSMGAENDLSIQAVAATNDSKTSLAVSQLADDADDADDDEQRRQQQRPDKGIVKDQDPGNGSSPTKRQTTKTSPVALERPIVKKAKTFRPWLREDQKRPEDVDELLSSGFFTRTQLPPVKYTRLPVLAVSGQDLDKAKEEAGGARVRVSMDLAPVVWYEGRRRTVRMSWQVTHSIPEVNENLGSDVGDQGKSRETRTSWIPASRFSWMPGQEETANLNRHASLSAQKSPTGSARNPKSEQLRTVSEDEEHEEHKEAWEIKHPTSASESGAEPKAAAHLHNLMSGTSGERNYNEPHSYDADDVKSKSLPSEGDDRYEKPKNQAGGAVETAVPAEDTAHEEPQLEVSTQLSAARNELGDDSQTHVENHKAAIGHHAGSTVEALQEGGDRLQDLSSQRFRLSVLKLSEALASQSPDEEDDNVSSDSFKEIEESAKPTVTQNRMSWMLNTGAPSPQEVKILAAVPKEGTDEEDKLENEQSSVTDGNVELKILSAYELPAQAQVLAVIAEEDETQSIASMHDDRDERGNDGSASRASWPMMVSSPGLPNMRMIGLAEVDKPNEVEGEGFESASNYSDDESRDDESLLSHTERSVTREEDTGTVQDVAQTASTEVQPLRVKHGNERRSELVGRPPYIPGQIILMGAETSYRRGAIAGMEIWSDNDTSEDAWQRSEKALIEGILDCFGTLLATSENYTGEATTEYEDVEVDLSFLQAPLLDTGFLREHAVDDIFAEKRDPSKPPPLPPLPTTLPGVPQRPLSSPGLEWVQSPDSVKSISSVSSTGSPSRSSSAKKQKPVAVHSPGIGSLIMKRGLF